MGLSYRSVVTFLLLLVIASVVVFADPNAPSSVTTGANNHRTYGTVGTTVAASAGNVTELTISGVATSQSWQGFYGNITGTIVLDNAANQSFYRWDLASPQGEIYASNNSAVVWTNVSCVNMTNNGTRYVNYTLLDSMFGIAAGASDGFNITFNETYAGSFLIGTRTIGSADLCPKTNLYNASGRTANWQEVLMSDNTSKSVMFVSVLNQNGESFDGVNRDFQLLVAEDGHNGNTAATNWFFFVELE